VAQVQGMLANPTRREGRVFNARRHAEDVRNATLAKIGPAA